MTAPSQVLGRVKSKTTTASVLPSTSPSTTQEDKGKGNPRQQQQNTHVKLKVVVRGLPPNLPESLFKDTTKEWINETTVDWYYYVSGKLYERYASLSFMVLTLVGINPMSDPVHMQNSNLWMHSLHFTKPSMVTPSPTQKVSPLYSTTDVQAVHPVQ